MNLNHLVFPISISTNSITKQEGEVEAGKGKGTTIMGVGVAEYIRSEENKQCNQSLDRIIRDPMHLRGCVR